VIIKGLGLQVGLINNKMKKFIEFALIWYSQQMAIPFWIIGHVHLSLNVYQDIHEILASLGLNVLVAVGFVIDYRKNGKK